MSSRILIVEDDAAMRSVYARLVSGAGHEVTTAGNGEEALAIVKRDESFHVALVDYQLPKMDGHEVLAGVQKMSPETKVIIMTGFGTVGNAVKAMKLGASDYLLKPIERESLLKALAQQLHVSNLEHKVARLQSELRGRHDAENMVSLAPAMKEVNEQVAAARQSRANVMILGESGTGKEIVARAIHYGGHPDGPFVAINCAALPDALIESELFGHRKGAFTGAGNDSMGLFRAADGGTILLDEIFDISPEIQAKLLRVVQERTVRSVGAMKETSINVRVVAATNKDPRKAMEQGGVRKDLYYRLSVIEIRVPPLRERKVDIEPFIEHFKKRFSVSYGFQIGSVSPEAMAVLLQYNWPGNVRELENVVERWFAMNRTGGITVNDLPAAIIADGTDTERTRWGSSPVSTPLRNAEREMVRRTLEATGQNKSRAATILGISRKKLYKILGEDQA